MAQAFKKSHGRQAVKPDSGSAWRSRSYPGIPLKLSKIPAALGPAGPDVAHMGQSAARRKRWHNAAHAAGPIPEPGDQHKG
jgi:hypothetical protein